MRLFITTAVAALAIAGAASAQTDTAAKPAPKPTSGSYIAVSGGFIGSSDYDYKVVPGVKLNADVDSGFQGSLAWGQHLNNNWRVELAAGYRKQDVSSKINTLLLSDDGKVSTISLDINADHDFPVKGAFKPYVGAGLGVAGVKFDDGLLDDKGSGLALRAMAGAAYQVSPTIAVFAEGRYERVGSLKVEVEYLGNTAKSTVDMSSFGALAGVRFGF